MERYSHLQALPNSPLTPLTPLSENTSFNFNFGGDGSLDIYIDSVRQEHRVEQQRKKLLQQANRSYNKPGGPLHPKRYTEEFLKIRDVFESGQDEQQNISLVTLKDVPNNRKNKRQQQKENYVSISKTPMVKITHTGATPLSKSVQRTPMATSTQKMSDYVTTPTNIRTPLKQRNNNTLSNISSSKPNYGQQQQSQQRQQMFYKSNRQQQQGHQQQVFRQASPIASRPLCPHVAKILQRNGLSMYSGLFQREEIDLYVFQMLKLKDLHDLGIINPKHCELILADAFYVGKYY